MTDGEMSDVERKLRQLQVQGAVSAFSVKEERKESGSQIKIWLNHVGKASQKLTEFLQEHEVEKPESINQGFYFLSSELRPGSGIIRVFGGRSEGPGGTVTCLLSSRDGRDTYLVAAGHVLTNFWHCNRLDSRGSIYRYRKGFPATDSTRFLGNCLYLPRPKERPRPISEFPKRKDVELDIGIVKLQGESDLKPRTTCYGSFGEWPPREAFEVKKGAPVMKCGSQETHWTKARVKEPSAVVPVYGPGGLQYRFKNQILLEDIPVENNKIFKPAQPDYPNNPPRTPFAVPGDSGTMVVDQRSKRPLGMLIAGSILDGIYVVTPFDKIEAFWTFRNLVMLRA